MTEIFLNREGRIDKCKKMYDFLMVKSQGIWEAEYWEDKNDRKRESHFVHR